jgi:hypothetical protein
MKQKIFNNLSMDGFHIFRNIINEKEINIGKKCFNKTKINYLNIKNFINNTILKTVNYKLENPLINIKYRASNNNNSIDASALHRDVINHKSHTTMNIFTCLIYLDNATMELIPKSHNKSVINYDEIIPYFKNRIKINIKPGDILLIHSSLIHRGIYYNIKTNNRRLIQLFDCVFKTEHPLITNNIFHTSHKNDNNLYSNLMYYISKIKLIINIINFIYYLNTARGYGFNLNVFKKLKLKKNYKFISLESNKRYIPKYNNTWELGNVYIMNYKTNNITPKQNNLIYLYMNINTILFFIITITIFIIIYKYTLNQLIKRYYKQII